MNREDLSLLIVFGLFPFAILACVIIVNWLENIRKKGKK